MSWNSVVRKKLVQHKDAIFFFFISPISILVSHFVPTLTLKNFICYLVVIYNSFVLWTIFNAGWLWSARQGMFFFPYFEYIFWWFLYDCTYFLVAICMLFCFDFPCILMLCSCCKVSFSHEIVSTERFRL